MKSQAFDPPAGRPVALAIGAAAKKEDTVVLYQGPSSTSAYATGVLVACAVVDLHCVQICYTTATAWLSMNCGRGMAGGGAER